MNIFEFATRNKLRFPYKGMISAEDLWDLRPAELDKIYKALNSQKRKEDSEESLLAAKNSGDVTLEIQIEIIKHIVAVKLEEQDVAKKAKEIREKKQHIMALIKDKKDEALKNMNVEDLEKMLAEMEG